MNPQRILIELDCLLDTRLGTLFRRFPLQARKVDLEAYCNRIAYDLSAVFGVESGQWKTWWDHRDVETLKESNHTVMLLELKKMMAAHYVRGKTSPIHGPLEVAVNVAPYQIWKELAEELADVIQHYLWPDVEVKIITVPLVEQTPEWIKAHYEAVVMYDFVRWMELHHGALSHGRMPTVTFYAPGVLVDTDPERLEQMRLERADPNAETIRVLAEYLTLKLLKPALFSLRPLTPSSDDDLPA